ncbi:MAG: SufD family Fe-S cluster assembly protein [Treponemataceae bacterium]|nr:SufD family Fe-S cluster assembly protein [Treponemataceae bacterium]
MASDMKINRLTSPSWNWLKMNDAEVAVPDEIALSLAQNVKDQNGGTSISSSCVIRLDSDKKNAVFNNEILAKPGSDIKIVMLASAKNNTTDFQAIHTKINAEKNSKVHLIKINLLGKKATQIDRTYFLANENATVEVTHIVLGGEKTFVEVCGDLLEYNASFTSDMGYILGKDQNLDMNYIVNHIGKKTDCKMNVRGTLKENAKKTYRGTIDFKNGCAGARGDEQEETLLLSENAENNSIPIILCDEEDVAGEHGASIGRLGDDILFYMQSRGIPKAASENSIARSKVQRLLPLINDEQVVSEVNAFLDF